MIDEKGYTTWSNIFVMQPEMSSSLKGDWP